jgi:hypothetical protein
MSARGFPGNRVEANRAGMTATTVSGCVESTAAPVDEGCTTNHSTIVEVPCYDPGIAQMDWKRTATLGVIGGTLVTLLARASTSVVAPPAIPSPVQAAHDTPAVLPEVDRLHQRLSAPVTPMAPARNLFAFGSKAPVPREPVARLEALPAPPPMPQPPALTLVGLAEEAGPDGPIRTAIISGVGGLHFVRVGEAIVGGYRLTAIRDDSVEVSDAANAAPFQLRLK